MSRSLFLAIGLTVGSICLPARAEPLTRAEALQIAQAYYNYRWQATVANVLQGKDPDGVVVHTPNRAAFAANPDPDLWIAAATNTGIPYKWGGFDSIESFETGIRKGKAAGDIYSPEKRQVGGETVSSHAVGIDCSGFISRCWKLRTKQSTESLPLICVMLPSAADLKPGDIMDAPGGHVILFAKWLNADKTSAQFYEASGCSKVVATTYPTVLLGASGFKPMRYKLISDGSDCPTYLSTYRAHGFELLGAQGRWGGVIAIFVLAGGTVILVKLKKKAG